MKINIAIVRLKKNANIAVIGVLFSYTPTPLEHFYYKQRDG